MLDGKYNESLYLSLLKRNTFHFLLYFAVLGASVCDAIVWNKIIPEERPSYSGSGKIVAAFGYSDELGEHRVFLTEVQMGKPYEPNHKSELSIKGYLIHKENFVEEWNLKDSATIPGSIISYEDESFNIFDLDKDGQAELSFSYFISSDGADP